MIRMDGYGYSRMDLRDDTSESYGKWSDRNEEKFESGLKLASEEYLPSTNIVIKYKSRKSF